MGIKDIRNQYILNGMPCHAYIVRCLRNERDMLVFERAYAETMLSYNFDRISIETSLALLSQKISANSPIYGKQFNIRGEGLDVGNFIDSLCLDVTIPKFANCTDYYKTFDKACCACQDCIYSPNYKNLLRADELKVLRYVFESVENLQYTKGLGLNASHFKAVYDVTHAHMSATTPKMFPMHRVLFKLLNKSVERYYRTDNVGKALDYKFRGKLAEELASLELPISCRSSEWLEKTILLFEESVFATVLPSQKEVASIVKKMASRARYNPPKIERLKVSKNGLEVGDDAGAVSLKEKPSSPVTEHSSETPDCSAKAASALELVRQSTKNNGDALDTLDFFAASGAKRVDKVIVDDIVNPFALSTEYIDIVDKEDLARENIIDISSRIVPDEELPLPELDMGNNLIFIPVVLEAELDACAISLNTRNTLILTKFESAVLQDGRVIVEVVRSDSGKIHLLMWVPRLRAFFSSDLSESVSNGVLLPIFSKRSVTKITYSPYWLYSVIHKYNKGQVQSIESIQSIHYLLGLDGFDYLTVLSMNGAIPANAMVDFKAKSAVSSLVFRMMPSYLLCYRKLHRRMNGDVKKNYEMYGKLIEAIGASYDMSFWLGTDTFLYTMPKPFSYKFIPVDIRRISVPGYIVTYSAEYLIDPPRPLFGQILYLLADKGRFKNLEMQIISYTDNQLVLFISDACFSYAVEILSRTIFDYAADKARYGILIDYKYVHISKDKLSDKHTSTIASVTTGNAVVGVPEADVATDKEAMPF